MTKLQWDVFISHASEDKDEVARPLADLLAGHRLRVWLDECELKLGHSLRAKIDEGLRASRFGLIILSSHFFLKQWTRAELGGLLRAKPRAQMFLSRSGTRSMPRKSLRKAPCSRIERR